MPRRFEKQDSSRWGSFPMSSSKRASRTGALPGFVEESMRARESRRDSPQFLQSGSDLGSDVRGIQPSLEHVGRHARAREEGLAREVVKARVVHRVHLEAPGLV